MNYELLRKVPVTIEAGVSENGKAIAIADIAGNNFSFSPTSRISRALEIMTPEELSNRMTGGHYFLVDGNLIDFRDSHYTGFIHTDASIHELVEHIGIMRNPKVRVFNNTLSTAYGLGKHWSSQDIHIPVYAHGGQFSSQLHFGWNPFARMVNSAFMLIRLICSNGMMGLRTFLNTKIPLINRWEEHLTIANKQIQNKVGSMITGRLADMGRERATVGEVLSVKRHVENRISAIVQSEADDNDVSGVNILETVSAVIDPKRHLDNVYRENVFNDRNLAAQMPSHLTVFDLYNVVTEVRTHTRDSESSTMRGLDMIANRLVFDRKDPFQHFGSNSRPPPLSQFSDPDAAFFGKVI